jgi:hypothetical protein
VGAAGVGALLIISAGLGMGSYRVRRSVLEGDAMRRLYLERV